MSYSVSKAEKSYIQAGLLDNPPHRLDGRPLHSFRNIALETGVSSLANGSARLSIGRNFHDGGGGTEVLAATKLEVETDEEGNNGRIVCNVTCSPAAYPHLSTPALDDLQHDLTTVIHQTLTHASLHPSNLAILPRKKAWLLSLDIVILSDEGNIYDALFMASRAALWDTKVPGTRTVEYRAKKAPVTKDKAAVGAGDMDVDDETPSGFDTRQQSSAADFELSDYWGEGEDLSGKEKWPICVTLNMVPPVHFLDAQLQEELATPTRLLVMYSFAQPSAPVLQGTHLLGAGEVILSQLEELIKIGERHAKEIYSALEAKLRDEHLRRNQKAREKFAKR